MPLKWNGNEVMSLCDGCWTYQNSDAGDVLVIGLHTRSATVNDDASCTHAKLIFPVNFLESVPPKVSSPLVIDSEVVGSNDTATRCCGIFFCEERLSVTAGQHGHGQHAIDGET